MCRSPTKPQKDMGYIGMLQKNITCCNNFSLLSKTWQKLQNKLYRVGGVKAWLINSEGHVLVGNNNLPPLCVQLQKSVGRQKKCVHNYQNCHSSDSNTKTDFFIFKCHAGLTSLVFPLTIHEQYWGAIVVGGVIADEKDGRGATQQAHHLHLPLDNYLSNLKSSPRFSSLKLQQTAETVLPAIQNFTKNLTKQLESLEKKHSLIYRKSWDQIMRDSLTKLDNKKYLHYRLQQELPFAKRQHLDLCLLATRLENLTTINEISGHSTGDSLLKEIASLLSKVARGIDIAVRYSGNIFALLLFGFNQEQGIKVAQKLLKLNKQNISLELELSVGIFTCTSAHRQPEVLTRSIYSALKIAKQNHTNIGVLPLPIARPVKHKKRRVVITGVGIISPLGSDKETFRQGIYEGRSGIRRITLFNADEFPCQIAGEARGFDPLQFIDATKLELIGKASSFSIAASKMAISDAKLDLKAERQTNMGVYIGSGVAGLEFAENQIYNYLKFGVEEISPYLSVAVFGGAVASESSLALNIKGYSATLSTACAAGTDAMGKAFHQIREGELDVLITGGVDAPIRRTILGSFCVINSLSTNYNHCPEQASRPFDRERDGFVLSEGAGVLIFEELQHALSRGAHIYGEVLGFGATNDAYHMSQPDPEGKAAAEAIRLALKDAQLEPHHIEYINTHGSSTRLNDPRETKIIKEVFGKHAYKLATSSTKSMLGHPIGASGGLELIACLLGIEDNFIPPTINYEFFDPDCDLDYIPNQARAYPLNIFLSTSFGFGGQNSSIIVSRY